MTTKRIVVNMCIRAPYLSFTCRFFVISALLALIRATDTLSRSLVSILSTCVDDHSVPKSKVIAVDLLLLGFFILYSDLNLFTKFFLASAALENWRI